MKPIFKLLFASILLSACTNTSSKKIAITIDDVPNVKLHHNLGERHTFFDMVDSLDIPLTIFVNEHLLGKPEPLKENRLVLQEWVKHPNITVGNHSYSHPYYSEVGIEKFTEEIVKGETYLRPWTKTHNKSLEHFRMPFNDLGKDSLEHAQLKQVMDSLGYKLTPFTIESSDWMFSRLYEHYLEIGDEEKAKWVSDGYISATLNATRFFEQVSDTLYGRNVSHIYLAHDNLINTLFLPTIIDSLRSMNYEIVSLDEALEDPIYSQKDHYFKKWGVSWIYRWITDDDERSKLMRSEPSIMEYYREYQAL